MKRFGKCFGSGMDRLCLKRTMLVEDILRGELTSTVPIGQGWEAGRLQGC